MDFELYQKLSWDTKNGKNSKIELFNPPFIIAFQLVAQQRINLKYFDRTIVNHIIACHLEEQIYSDSAETNLLKTKIKNFRDSSINKTASVSKIWKGILKGLADIEMIQYCNISSQFAAQRNHTLYSLTFDKKLAHLLQERTSISFSMQISREDTPEKFEEKKTSFTENCKKMELIEQNRKEIFGKLSCFYEDLTPFFS